MLTIAEIRLQFPNPIQPPTIGAEMAGEYCVGGAIRAGVFPDSIITLPFPSASVLSVALQELNPALSDTLAEDFAHIILITNDLGRFEAAWQWAEKAVDWTSEEV